MIPLKDIKPLPFIQGSTVVVVESGDSNPDAPSGNTTIANVAGLQSALDAKAASTDPRFSDARNPTTHKASHSLGGADPLSPSDIGAVASNFDASLKRLALTPDALAGSSALSALSISQTWNTTGNPALVRGYVTNTTSGAGAKLLDLGVGSTTRLNLDVSGHLYTNSADDYAAYGFLNSARGIGYNGASEKMLMYANASGVVNAGVSADGLFLPQTSALSWSSSGWASASDLFLSRAAAATLQLGVNHPNISTRHTIKGHNVTTGTAGELVLRAGTGTGGAIGTAGVWLGNPASSALKQYEFNGAILGGFFNEGLRGYLRFCGGSGGEVTLASTSNNGNLEFIPHGTGKVKFGTFVASASHTAAGYIEILDASGTARKLAVVA